MPKKYRLSRADLSRLPRGARRIHGDYFSVSVTLYPALRGPKIACVVPKKIAARAVDRNRIERGCREALRPLIRDIQKPLALLFHAKREARDATQPQLARDIEKLLRNVERATMPTL